MNLRALALVASLVAMVHVAGLQASNVSDYQDGDGSPASGTEQYELMQLYPGGTFHNRTICEVYNTAGQRKNAILRWANIFGYGVDQIPPNATITSATVKLHGNTYGTYGETIKAYQVLESWNQNQAGQVTWVNRTVDSLGNTAWSVQGCDDTPSRSTTLLGSATYTSFQQWIDIDVTGAVQNWSANPSSNNGVILTGDGTSHDWGCDGAGCTTQADRPILEITWDVGSSTDVTAPGAVTNQYEQNQNNQVQLSWTNPTDSDLWRIMVVRKAGSAPTGTPTNGTVYNVSDAVGDGTVVFDGDWNGYVVPTSFLDTGVTNGTPYYYAIFAADTSL
ncbi:MAG: DNRLRE domain-containing protein, partial [Rhodanobacteraceae bacterium]